MTTLVSDEGNECPKFGSITPELYKLIQFRGREENHQFSCIHGERASVFHENSIRKKIAGEQKEVGMKSKKELINIITTLTEEFLKLIGISMKYYNGSAVFNLDDCEIKWNKKFIPYKDIACQCNLNNINHIIWMKFAKVRGEDDDKRHLGVVAASNDINFLTNNTSGIIIDSLDLEWDESFVLIFPLSSITDGMRKDIEVGIGNYLTENKVPILDLYSHRFQ